jgi:hypothetical protein
METIKINSIEKREGIKGAFWVVKYNDTGDATIGGWDAQLADYIEKDVGVGGTVSVFIQQKGNYTNITKVDMTSGKKNTTITESEKVKPTSLMDDRSKSIVAQCLTKVVGELTGQVDEGAREFVLDTYNYFLKAL